MPFHPADIPALEAYQTMTEATIRIMCPSLNCRRILTVPVSSRGKKVRCRNCGTTLLIPQRPPGKSEPAEAPSPKA